MNRKKLFNYFLKKIKKTKLLVTPKKRKNFIRGGYYGYKVIMKKNKFINIEKFIKILKLKNVDARRTLTPPLHLTKTFRNKSIKNFYKNYNFSSNLKNLKNSEWFHKNHISFPSFYKKEHKKLINEYVRSYYLLKKYLKFNGQNFIH